MEVRDKKVPFCLKLDLKSDNWQGKKRKGREKNEGNGEQKKMEEEQRKNKRESQDLLSSGETRNGKEEPDRQEIKKMEKRE